MSKQCLSAKELWNCGESEGFYRNNNGSLIFKNKGVSGIFISRIYDSGEEGMQWNNIVLNVDFNAVLGVYVWLFDKAEGQEKEKNLGIRKYFEWMKGQAKYHSNYRNMLLYGHGCGRYARIAVEIMSSEGGDVVFGGYSISFPKESFSGYLPAIYHDNIHLDRFLAVHQTIYLGIEFFIDNLARQLDYNMCSRKQAVRLAGWMGWGELAEQVDEKILRKLLQSGIFLADRKGTCGYYITLTEILTGKKAVIIENTEEGRATILVMGQPKGKGKQYLEWLQKNVPIGIKMDFVILHNTDMLDELCFLDKTSYLSQYESQIAAGWCTTDRLLLM